MVPRRITVVLAALLAVWVCAMSWSAPSVSVSAAVDVGAAAESAAAAFAAGDSTGKPAPAAKPAKPAAAAAAAPAAKGKAKGKSGKAKSGKVKSKGKGKSKTKKGAGGAAPAAPAAAAGAPAGGAAGAAAPAADGTGKTWSADDFLRPADEMGAVATNTFVGGFDDDEEEEEVSKSWEEETEIENWHEEEDDNMPKFVTLQQLNDSSKLAKLKRHQLLRIGRSLLRDPKFNDCLTGMVQMLVEHAKASTCAIPDVNERVEAMDAKKALEEARAASSDTPTEADTNSANTAAAATGAATPVSTIDRIAQAIDEQLGKVDFKHSKLQVEHELVSRGSGTNPTGKRVVERNVAGEEKAMASATKVQQAGLDAAAAAAKAEGKTISVALDPATGGTVTTTMQPTPYNPTRTVAYNIIGRTNVFPSPPTKHAKITPETEVFDVAVIGCGLSGLTTMYRLRNLTIVCLEWSHESGGIAAQQTKDNITWATGAAYAPVPYAAILDLWHEIGLPKPEEIELGKPRDSFWVDRNLYLGIWEEALDDLPDDWYEFKSLIDSLDFAGMIGVPPLEREPKKAKIFDQISAGELIENFGTKLKTMLDLYCRSALGSVCADISAMAFLDFYSDELYERVAFPGGTGAVTKRLVELITQPSAGAGGVANRIRTNKWVYDLHHLNDTMVEVRYVDTNTGGESNGQTHSLLARRIIMATPLNIAAKIITDLPEQQRRAMESIEHMHYLVHNVHTPVSYFHSSYDTWTADVAFTDIIVARWQEATLSNTPVPREQSILSVYQPLPRSMWSMALTDSEVRALSEQMLVDLEKLLPGYKTAENISIDTHRWPGSINILRPGLSTGAEGAIIRANHNRIVFAGSNLGIPSLEEAIERGLIASKELMRLVAADKDLEQRKMCDAGKQGLGITCENGDESLTQSKSVEETEMAAQKEAVAAASNNKRDESAP